MTLTKFEPNLNTTLETHPMKGKVVAIDGPAGAGKGTLATYLARVYRMKYLDTGTLYRTVAFKVLEKGLNPSVEEDALQGTDLSDYDFRHIGDNKFRVFLGGEDITDRIRSPEAGLAASKVSFFTSVRRKIKVFEIEYAEKWSQIYGVVLDGQDTGTVIYPDANFKFFLKATAEARAKRRIQDFHALGHALNYEEVLAQILERDARDTGRASAPVKAADDAVVLDTTELSAEEVKSIVLRRIATPTVQD